MTDRTDGTDRLRDERDGAAAGERTDRARTGDRAGGDRGERASRADRAAFAQVEAELAGRGFTRMVFELDRITSLLDLLGSPQRAYPSIHLTGTNGKTSTARMIDSLLRALGLHTGRYTSPHLETVRERISLDGEPVDEARFTAVYQEVKPLAELVDDRSAEPLTYFDMTTALAFATFADAPVDVAVVEVGLGGAEDATNVIQAGVCVLTPVGLDHTEWLGDTLQDIAVAKAGIIHPGATVICAAQDEEAARPILQRCAEVGATVAREGSEFGVLRRAVAVGGQVLTLQGLGGVYEEVFVPLHGAHQAQNAAVALAAVEAFLGAGAAGSSTWRRCGKASPPPAPRGGWSGCVPRRRSCSTGHTTRRAWRPRSPRCRRSSRSASWSPSWVPSPTRTPPACWSCWSRWSTNWW